MAFPLVRLLYPSVPAEFESSFSRQESIARLKASLRDGVFGRGMFGDVSDYEAKIFYVNPMFGNGFKPVFVGCWAERNGRTVLSGRFTQYLSARIIKTLMIGLFSFGFISSLFKGTRVGLEGAGIFILAFIGMVAFDRLCWWMSISDITHISQHVRGALYDGGAHPDQADPSNARVSATTRS